MYKTTLQTVHQCFHIGKLYSRGEKLHPGIKGILQREEQDWNRIAGVKIWLRGRHYKPLSPTRSKSLSLLLPPAPLTAATSTINSGIWIQKLCRCNSHPRGTGKQNSASTEPSEKWHTCSCTQTASSRGATNTNISTTPSSSPAKDPPGHEHMPAQNKPCQKADLSKPFYCPSQPSDRLKA